MPAPAIPAAQRTSDASLLIRLQAPNENNRLLAKENKRLAASSPTLSVINEPPESTRAVTSNASSNVALQ